MILKLELIIKISKTNPLKVPQTVSLAFPVYKTAELTAALLILPHIGETTSPPQEAKVSNSKCVAVAMGKSFLIRTKSGSKSKKPKMEVDRSSSADSALENRPGGREYRS
ncbi:hypothetical protein V6N13_018084 [Hibiscus sabdariffa]